MYYKIIFSFALLGCLFLNTSVTYKTVEETFLDVHSYHVTLKPDLVKKSIEGKVAINFSIASSYSQVIFDCGSLKTSGVEGKQVKDYQQIGEKVIVYLYEGTKRDHIQVEISYVGTPTKGLIFSASPQQAYTVYNTAEWMVCNFSPDDKATLKLDLLIPQTLSCIASGMLTKKKEKEDSLVLYTWMQQHDTPAYTYGFVIGVFIELKEKHDAITLSYYSHTHSEQELKTIFGTTGDMISFFEEKSGVPYFQTSYAQVLIGNHYQEMSGCAVLKHLYGEMVLKDSTETNLISHELAHQWWGNRITCKNWNHIWLNEGFATYMSAAYNEYRFGKKKYLENIEAYYNVYEKIKNNGLDKPLVFTDWTNPSPSDRNLIYFKGAYVLFLLREELGDELFWKAVKDFSIKYYGKSVTTKDFQKSVEESTGRDLGEFFGKWVY